MGGLLTSTLPSLMGTWVVSCLFAITNNAGVNLLVVYIFFQKLTFLWRLPQPSDCWVNGLMVKSILSSWLKRLTHGFVVAKGPFKVLGRRH